MGVGGIFSFADSEVAAVSVDGDTLRVRFAAARVAEPDPTTFSGWREGHVAGVELVCRGGPWPALQPGHVGRLAEGRVQVTGAWRTDLALPSELAGPATLELRFAHRTALEVEVTSLSLTRPHDAVFAESLAC